MITGLCCGPRGARMFSVLLSRSHPHRPRDITEGRGSVTHLTWFGCIWKKYVQLVLSKAGRKALWGLAGVLRSKSQAWGRGREAGAAWCSAPTGQHCPCWGGWLSWETPLIHTQLHHSHFCVYSGTKEMFPYHHRGKAVVFELSLPTEFILAYLGGKQYSLLWGG